MADRYQLGETVPIKFTNFNPISKVNENADTGYPTISVWDAAGAVVAEDQAMIQYGSAGEYYYIVATDGEGLVAGWWRAQVKCQITTAGAIWTLSCEWQFEVKE